MSSILTNESRSEMEVAIERYLNDQEENKTEFPVDFNDLWRWAGYSTKGNAKTSLEKSQLVVDIDYFKKKASLQPKQHGGQNKQTIHLTTDAAKNFLMLANTEQGKQARLYFIECEKKWRLLKKNVANGRVAMLDKATGEVVNNDYKNELIVLDIEERRTKLRQGDAEFEANRRKVDAKIKEHELSNFRMAQEIAESMGMDECDKIYMKDLQRRVFSGLYAPTSGQLAIEDSNSGRGRLTSFPVVAQKYDLKYKQIKASAIGKLAAKLYRERYNGENPLKHRVEFRGRACDENAYYERDEDILRYAIMSHSINCSASDVQEFAQDNGFSFRV